MYTSSDQFIKTLLDSKDYSLEGENWNDETLYDYLLERIKNLKGDNTKIITVVGGVASGKTTLAHALASKLPEADTITTDAFAAGTREYRHTQYGNVEKKYDLNLYNQKIEKLKQLGENEVLKFPQYDEMTGLAAAAGEDNFPKEVKKVKYFIIEGDFNFSKGKEDLSIYFHLPDDVRTENRVKRDVEKRGWGDIEKLKNDIKIRDEKQHFPFTLPNAGTSDILIVATSSNGSYHYSVYIKK